MQNRWMRIIPSQSSTQKTIIWQFAGLQVNGNRTSHNFSGRISSCQNCLKISQRRTFSFFKIKKCGIYGYNCIIKGSLTKNQMMNFVRILFMTKCNSILPHVQNLILLSLLFIFILAIYFYILYFLNNIYYNFIIND